MAHARRSGRGFTLTELLIVVAVLALLATMAIPAFSRVAAMGRSIKCQKNLASIAQAYNTFVARQAALDTHRIFSPNTWRTSIHPLLGGQSAPFYCPEDEMPEFSMPVSSIRIYGYDGESILYDVQLFDTHPYWLEGAHNDFLPDKPGMWRVNNDVYDGGSLDRYNMPTYTPGSDPDVSWWIIEDQRYGDKHQYATGDQDFNDLDIRMTDLGAGIYEVKATHGDAGYSFGVVDEDGVETRETNGKIGPLVLEGDGGSYGVNWQAARLRVGDRRILVMDFSDDIIYVGRRLESIPSNWQSVEARHLGKVNYAMVDGSVHSASPEEIDPADSDIDGQFWTPDNR